MASTRSRCQNLNRPWHYETLSVFPHTPHNGSSARSSPARHFPKPTPMMRAIARARRLALSSGASRSIMEHERALQKHVELHVLPGPGPSHLAKPDVPLAGLHSRYRQTQCIIPEFRQGDKSVDYHACEDVSCDWRKKLLAISIDGSRPHRAAQVPDRQRDPRHSTPFGTRRADVAAQDPETRRFCKGRSSAKMPHWRPPSRMRSRLGTQSTLSSAEAAGLRRLPAVPKALCSGAGFPASDGPVVPLTVPTVIRSGGQGTRQDP